MKAEDHLERAKIFKQQLDKTTRRRAVMTSVALIGATVVSILFLTYAFVQKGVAQQAQSEMIRMKEEADATRKLLIVARQELAACKATNK
jgi:hypothetical protein